MTAPVLDFLALALLALAAYRSAAFIVQDEVPFGPARDAALRRWPPPNPFDGTPGYRRGYLLTCMSCMTVWTGVAWWGAWMLWPRPTLIAAGPFAVAGLARALAVSRA